MMDPGRLRAQILAQTASEPSPTRSSVRRKRALVLASTAAVTAGLVVATGIRPGTRTIPYLALTWLGWGAVATLITYRMNARADMIGPPASKLLGLGLAGTALAFLIEAASSTAFPQRLSVEPATHLGCFIMTLIYSSVPAVGLIILHRGSALVSPRATAALLGVAAGLWGVLASGLHCATPGVIHVGLTHVGPIAALALVFSVAIARIVGLKSDK